MQASNPGDEERKKKKKRKEKKEACKGRREGDPRIGRRRTNMKKWFGELAGV